MSMPWRTMQNYWPYLFRNRQKRRPKMHSARLFKAIIARLVVFIVLTAASRVALAQPAHCSTETRNAPLAGVANRVNILILGDGFTDAECNAFSLAAQRFQTELTAFEPYKTYSSYLHFESWLEPSPDRSDPPPPPPNAVLGVSHPQCADDPNAPVISRTTTYGVSYC